jgi:hypothetical protein
MPNINIVGKRDRVARSGPGGYDHAHLPINFSSVNSETGIEMAENIDDLTVNYEDEEGKLLVKELAKEVLTKGSWSTIMFLYQDYDSRKESYSDPKVTIRRYRKSGGQFRQQSKFNISSGKQALQIVDILRKWYA